MVVEFLGEAPENVDRPILVIRPESMAEGIALQAWPDAMNPADRDIALQRLIVVTFPEKGRGEA